MKSSLCYWYQQIADVVQTEYGHPRKLCYLWKSNVECLAFEEGRHLWEADGDSVQEAVAQ